MGFMHKIFIILLGPWVIHTWESLEGSADSRGKTAWSIRHENLRPRVSIVEIEISGNYVTVGIIWDMGLVFLLLKSSYIPAKLGRSKYCRNNYFAVLEVHAIDFIYMDSHKVVLDAKQ